MNGLSKGTILWMICICIAAALHFVHLEADFPNYSRWMDWSKYTDEGWYANAAVQHYLRGSWNVPGDFNTGAAVPVWPFLEWMLFHFTGVGIKAVRALAVACFCCNLFLTYRLVRRGQPQWVALLSCSMIVTSSFLYCFGRLAILEPLLVSLTLISLLLARAVGEVKATIRRYAMAVSLGIVFCWMVLTKTTAIFLIPAILYSLWFPLRGQRKRFLAAAAVAAIVAITLWGSYFFLLVKPHYLADYRYFFKINVYPKPTTVLGWIKVLGYAMHGIFWVDRTVVLAGIFLLVAAAVLVRTTFLNPLFISSLLAIGGYFVFIAYIDNMQPRYYAVIAYFICIIVPIALAALLRKRRALGIAVTVVIAGAMAKGAWEVGGFLIYPEYTFVNAARGIASYIDQHPNGNRLIVSISGNDLTLITGLPSLCDDFGTIDLPSKLGIYKPGWYAAWNDLDAGSVQDLHTHYDLQEAASFKAFDDDDRDTLVLYRLIPRMPQ